MQALLLLLAAAAGALPVTVHGDENIWTFHQCIEDCVTQQEVSDSTGCCDGHVSWVDGMYDSSPCFVPQRSRSLGGARSGEAFGASVVAARVVWASGWATLGCVGGVHAR